MIRARMYRPSSADVALERARDADVRRRLA